MNKLQKYLKLVSQKLGTLLLPCPNGLGFQVKNVVVTNLKVRKKKFLMPLLGLFLPETPKLNGRNLVQGVNTLAVSLLRYSAAFITWRK